MQICKLKLTGVLLGAIAALTGGGLLAQQPLAPKPASTVAVAAAIAPKPISPVGAGGEARSKPTDSAAMTQTEAKLAKLRNLIRPQPGEHVTSMARIAWERDPWQAAIKAGREGKPVLAYGEGLHGVPCGFG